MEDSAPLTPVSTTFSAGPPPPTYYSPTMTPSPAGNTNNPIGLYGWRKRCLYLLILLLVVVILVNLGLTIWILVVLDFNMKGMGNLEVTKSGIRLEGPAEFVGPLYVKNISTDQGSPLHLVSQESIDIRIKNGTSLQLGNSSLNISANQFSIVQERSSTPLVSVNGNGVSIGATRVEVTGSLGATINGPLETTQVQSPANQDLQVQSLSGELELTGGRGVHIHDGPGFDGVQVTSHSDLRVTSQNGQVVLRGGSIAMEGLPVSTSGPGSGAGVYEVCVCGTGIGGGTLYLVPANSNCVEDNGICTP